jgi:putative transposase
MAEYRRRLPHFQPDGEYLSVTWRLQGSLPVAPSDVIYATPGHAFAAQDRALAQRRGALWLSDTRVARYVADTIRDGERQQRFYESQAWVIMPNHVHLLVLPQAALPKITHWIKGRTAREANRLLGRAGAPFWQHESYDHWVRS